MEFLKNVWSDIKSNLLSLLNLFASRPKIKGGQVSFSAFGKDRKKRPRLL